MRKSISEQVWALTRTWPAAGSGTAASSTTDNTSGDVGSPFLCWRAAFILVVVYGSSKWVGEKVLKRSRTLDWVDQNEWTKIGAKIILMNEPEASTSAGRVGSRSETDAYRESRGLVPTTRPQKVFFD